MKISKSQLYNLISRLLNEDKEIDIEDDEDSSVKTYNLHADPKFPEEGTKKMLADLRAAVVASSGETGFGQTFESLMIDLTAKEGLLDSPAALNIPGKTNFEFADLFAKFNTVGWAIQKSPEQADPVVSGVEDIILIQDVFYSVKFSYREGSLTKEINASKAKALRLLGRNAARKQEEDVVDMLVGFIGGHLDWESSEKANYEGIGSRITILKPVKPNIRYVNENGVDTVYRLKSDGTPENRPIKESANAYSEDSFIKHFFSDDSMVEKVHFNAVLYPKFGDNKLYKQIEKIVELHRDSAKVTLDRIEKGQQSSYEKRSGKSWPGPKEYDDPRLTGGSKHESAVAILKRLDDKLKEVRSVLSNSIQDKSILAQIYSELDLIHDFTHAKRPMSELEDSFNRLRELFASRDMLEEGEVLQFQPSQQRPIIDPSEIEHLLMIENIYNVLIQIFDGIDTNQGNNLAKDVIDILSYAPFRSKVSNRKQAAESLSRGALIRNRYYGRY